MKKFKDILPVTNVLEFKKRLWFTDYAFRICKWFEGEKKGPIRIDAEITRQCNSNCIFCSRRASKIDLNEESKRVEMPKERWIELAKESANLGVREWNISGIGEPMMRADILLPLMRVLKAYDIFGELTTNGMLWKDEHIKEVVDMGWDSVCISIDGPDEKIHDSLRRVKGAFKKATYTAKRFTYWKKKLNSEYPSITLNVVLNKMNYNKLPEMVKLANKLGANAIFVEPMILFSSLVEPLKLGNKEIKELPTFIEKARELGEKYYILPTISCVGIELEFDKEIVKNVSKARKILIKEAKKFKRGDILSIPCYFPWYFLMIRVDGSTVPCGELEGYVENVRNKSLEEVWFGERFEKLRNLFISQKLPSSCDRCRPNTINDIKQIRKAIIKGRDITYLQEEILDLLKQNAELRSKLYELKKGGKTELHEEWKKEFIKMRNSLTFKLFYKFGNCKVGKFIKKLLGVYV
jgi:MoaA/NifB/PqqE/SkfB family radical SAM enzyme